MKTVSIKGKNYVEVSERIKAFRSMEEYKGYSLITDIVSLENGVCIMKAIIKDSQGVVRATGTAYEKEGSTFINKTSYIENCETSAWGRALGNLGIGIDCGIASLEEVQERGSVKRTQEEVSIKQQILNRLSTLTEKEKAGYRKEVEAGNWEFNQDFLDHLTSKYGNK